MNSGTLNSFKIPKLEKFGTKTRINQIEPEYTWSTWHKIRKCGIYRIYKKPFGGNLTYKLFVNDKNHRGQKWPFHQVRSNNPFNSQKWPLISTQKLLGQKWPFWSKMAIRAKSVSRVKMTIWRDKNDHLGKNCLFWWKMIISRAKNDQWGQKWQFESKIAKLSNDLINGSDCSCVIQHVSKNKIS